MITCLLVRHAAHDLLGRILAGRMDGVSLNRDGRRQAVELREHLPRIDCIQIQSSPRQRAVETAALMSDKGEAELEVCGALDELDFGSWTGRTFASLARDPDWVRWNSERSKVRPPGGGETMQEAQRRIVTHLRRTRESFSEGCLVMVTHAEVIRAAALHFMKLPIDAWSQIDVPPASITRFGLELNSFHVADRAMDWR